MDPTEVKLRREAEQKIEKSGRGTCTFCKEGIVRNDHVSGGGWTWESESMVGFCDKGREKKHKPMVVWKPDEGVVNK